MEFGKKRIKRIETVLGEELLEQAIKGYNAGNALSKEYVVRQQDIAVLRALAVKVEHAEHGMYDPSPEVRYTFADGSVLVTNEGVYGKTSFKVAHWFATTEEKEAFDAHMAERNVVRWGFANVAQGKWFADQKSQRRQRPLSRSCPRATSRWWQPLLRGRNPSLCNLT